MTVIRLASPGIHDAAKPEPLELYAHLSHKPMRVKPHGTRPRSARAHFAFAQAAQQGDDRRQRGGLAQLFEKRRGSFSRPTLRDHQNVKHVITCRS
jgi:hypothetical protein